jgi:hypothetical protein
MAHIVSMGTLEDARRVQLEYYPSTAICNALSSHGDDNVLVVEVLKEQEWLHAYDYRAIRLQ